MLRYGQAIWKQVAFAYAAERKSQQFGRIPREALRRHLGARRNAFSTGEDY